MPLFRQRNLYQLTGHLADEGGVVTAKCLNETETHGCSHSIKFSEAFNPFPGHSPHPPEIYRNISASIAGDFYSGRAIFINMTGIPFRCQELVYNRVFPEGQHYGQAVLVEGPNPSPTPPYVPPSTCVDAFNQTGCAQMKNRTGSHNCVWCKSSDDVHELCFTKGHTPKKDWSCDDFEVIVV